MDLSIQRFQTPSVYVISVHFVTSTPSFSRWYSSPALRLSSQSIFKTGRWQPISLKGRPNAKGKIVWRVSLTFIILSSMSFPFIPKYYYLPLYSISKKTYFILPKIYTALAEFEYRRYNLNDDRIPAYKKRILLLLNIRL